MTPETFCEQFATFAEAPNGVAKLRELILQLAVQGKLGTQDVNDEPAETVIVGDVVSFLGGYAFKSEWFQDHPGIRLVRNQNIGHGDLDWSETEYLPEERAEEFSKFELHPGDLVLSLNRPFISTGLKLAWIRDADCPCLLVQRVACLRPIRDRLLPEFLYLWCNAPHFYQHAHIVPSSGVPYIATNRVEKMAMRLPPLAEQRRIVGKVDQLLGLCDELAARQAARREARERLVGATLDRLVSARSAAEFPAHAHRLRDHFDRLFDTPTTLPQLRQAILQLAVQGQLVPQDPNDEPASTELAKIKSERERRAALREIPRQREVPAITQAEHLFELPAGWEWARFGDLCLFIEAGWSPKCEERPRIGDEWGIIKISAVTWGRFNPDENKTLPSNLEPRTDCEIHSGDFLMSRANTAELVAKSVVVDQTPSRLMLNDKTLRVVFPTTVDQRYVNLFNNGAIARQYYVRVASGTSESMRNVSRESVLEMLVPVPPLSEQKRIVSKVTELLSLCDALEAKLTQAESASTQLLSAAVAHLLQEDSREGAKPRRKPTHGEREA